MKPSSLTAVLCALMLLLGVSGAVSNAYAARPGQFGPITGSEHARLAALVIGRTVTGADLSGRGFRANSLVQAPANDAPVLDRDLLLVFPPSAVERVAQLARMRVISATDMQSDTITLVLEVYGPAGELARTLSSAPIDAATLTTDTWHSLPLAASSSARLIGENELLAVRVHLNRNAVPGPAPAAQIAFDIALDRFTQRPTVTPTPTITNTPIPTATNTPAPTQTATASPTPRPNVVYMPIVARGGTTP